MGWGRGGIKYESERLEKRYVTLLAILLKSKNFLQQLKSKNNGPVLLFETTLILGIVIVSCYPVSRSFSLAWLLAFTKSFTWLVCHVVGLFTPCENKPTVKYAIDKLRKRLREC